MVSSGPLTDERYLALAGDAAEGVEGLSLWPDPVTSDLPGDEGVPGGTCRSYFPKNEVNRYSIVRLLRRHALRGRRQARRPRADARESLMTALESIKGWESGILPPITIGADHETQKQGFWVKVDKGSFKPITDWLKSE